MCVGQFRDVVHFSRKINFNRGGFSFMFLHRVINSRRPVVKVSPECNVEQYIIAVIRAGYFSFVGRRYGYVLRADYVPVIIVNYSPVA